MKPTEEQLARLPKWARNELWRLQRDYDAAKAEIAAMHLPADDRRPANGDYGTDRGKGLPCHTVRFPKWGVNVSASESGVYISGDDTLSFQPRASNAVIVTSKRAVD